jgi:hypothetical protein
VIAAFSVMNGVGSRSATVVPDGARRAARANDQMNAGCSGRRAAAVDQEAAGGAGKALPGAHEGGDATRRNQEAIGRFSLAGQPLGR